MPNLSKQSLPLVLAICSITAVAAPTAAPSAPPAASATSTKKLGGPPPTAGGNGGSVSTNSGNTAGQISPKKPKCPDPTVSCPAEKVIAK